jgi:3-hydroxyisobutyrate dehydrogenase-like beta-hydroxyacid dehydrogenase
MKSILFIGVGKMGLPMARHLRAGGHAVSAFDIAAARMALAAEAGLTTVADVAPALAVAPIVCSSLPDDAALEVVSRQVANHAQSGTVWIETSTVSLEASRDAAARARARGIACLRAPVSGNATMAERAALSVFVSGDPAAFASIKDLFTHWGPQQLYLGAAEEARVAKLVVNQLIVGTSTLLAEALALGEGAGLDRQVLWNVIEASAIASPIVKAKAPLLRVEDYTPTFTVVQMLKDVGLIRGAAAACGVTSPVMDVAAAALEAALANGAGGEDYAVVIREARGKHPR